jgi:cytoskeletal protein CcmA (bactofilin family)
VEVFPSGRVRGDIHTSMLCVNPGATIDGGLHMTIERLDESTDSPQTVSQDQNTSQERH